MKPASIIFLIVSVIIIIAGLVLCTAGVNLAREQDVALFATDVSVVGDDVIATDTFSGEIINKVKINLSDADVRIEPSGTEDTYIELVNFQIGTYDYSVQNKMLLVDNETSIFSIMHIADGNFSFDGLRHYLSYRTGKNTEKSLILYLGNDVTAKTFEISVKEGNVSVSGFDLSADYTVSIGTGSLMLSEIKTKSAVSVNVGTGDVILDGVKASTCEVTVKNGDVDAYLTQITGSRISDVWKGLSVDVINGNIDVSCAGNTLYGLSFDFTAPKGSVTYNGELQENGSYTFSDGISYLPYRLNAHSGSVSFRMQADGLLRDHSDFEKPAAHIGLSEAQNAGKNGKNQTPDD